MHTCSASTKQRADISTKLQRLLDAGIEVHAQVVLCPGINDDEVLEKTILDLAAEYPRITSVAIVPLGLTRYNTDARLTRVTPEFCRDVIDQVSSIAKTTAREARNQLRIVGRRDLLARRTPHSRQDHITATIRRSKMASAWSDHSQTSLPNSCDNSNATSWTSLRKTPGTIFTGTLFAPVLKKMIDKLNARFGTRLIVEPLENSYFGGDVSVAGLLTGQDLLQAREQSHGRVCFDTKTDAQE